MHRRSRLASFAAIALLSGSAVSAAHAATTGAVLYVDNTVSACTDSGSGTVATPFCTLQAASNHLTAGDTLYVEAGTYTSPTTITASGTASAPITLKFADSRVECEEGTGARINLPDASAAQAVTIENASYIDVENLCSWASNVTGSTLAEVNASHVLVSGGYLGNSGHDIAISGSSADDTVERTVLDSASAAVAVGTGVTGAVITTNTISGEDPPSSGVTVNGASGTEVVSNTISDGCVAGISVSGASAATTIENNVIAYGTDGDGYCQTTAATTQSVGLVVSADSANGTTEKYDSIAMAEGTAVTWAGTAYQTAAAFQTATGEGTADYVETGDSKEATVDDADALAPGELSTDISGNPRVDDPRVANTGTGVGYYDRGASETQSPVTAEFETVYATGGRGVFAESYTVAPCGTWGSTYTATLDWGDGQTLTKTGKPCNAEQVEGSHTYATPGTYTMTLTVTDGYSTTSTSQSVTTQGLDYTSYGPARILDTRKGIGAAKVKVAAGGHVRVKVAGNGGIPADAQAVALNLTATDVTASGYAAAVADGSGSPTTSTLNFGSGQTVANSAIVQVASDGYIDVYNGSKASGIDLIADVTGYFTPTAAAGYESLAPARILDTRKGTGAAKAQVASDSAISVGIAGVDGIPASATAVAVHVTVTDAHGGGYVAAEPDGSGTPTTSSTNFSAGQTVSNTVIVPIAADGKIELYNGATGPIDLIADVAGYFTTSSDNVYIPETPQRALDTRSGGGPLKADTAYAYPVSPVSYPGIVAVVANLTATEPTASGNIEAYPAGTTAPGVSNVNFGSGQTVANLALLDNSASTGADTEIYNDSTGTTQLIIDLSGYFTSD